MNRRKDIFESLLCDRNDEIDNATYALINLIVTNNHEADDGIEWDMQLIGEVEDFIEDLLRKNGVEPCRPYYEGEDEIPCYLGSDCSKKCEFRKQASRR